MKKQGMVWYHILEFLTPLGVLVNLFSPISNIQQLATQCEVTLGYFVYNIAMAYSTVYIALGLVLAALGIRLTIDLFRRSSRCVQSVRNMIVAQVVGDLVLLLAIGASFDYFDTSVIGSLFMYLLIWVPTYYYVRSRVGDRGAFYTSVKKDTSPVVCPQPAPQPVPTDPFEVIPNKLRGVTDQKQRDSIIAMTLYGRTNPYTGNAMTSEAEWDSYVQSYCEERDKAQQAKAEQPEPETPAEPDPQPLPQEEPEQKAAQPYEPEPIPEQPPEPDELPERPSFCRKCGKPLREDSDFCEYCGQRVK